MLTFLFLERKNLNRFIGKYTDRYSLLALVAVVMFFLIFELVYVSPIEQLYFDENIYQGIALNILHSGNALWCQLGTGYVKTCYLNNVYHDPAGWPAFIAMAFAIAGVGRQTAYNLQLLVGALSIIFVFLLAGALLPRKDFAVVSAFTMAVMPGLFIWARTQADLDLPFMMFATLSFFLFIVFIKRKNLYSLGAFAFSLVLVSYIRSEAILLVPIFGALMLMLGDSGILETSRQRFAIVRHTLVNDARAVLLLLVFLILLMPEVYYLTIELQSPSFGQNVTESVLSISNFKSNIETNVLFVLGALNGVGSFPAEFHYAVVPLAVLGITAIILKKRMKNRFGIALMLSLWFLVYFVFYTSFYAGSASGLSSRFILQELPPICLLAAFALVSIGDAGSRFMVRMLRALINDDVKCAISNSVLGATMFVLLVLPFYQLIPTITLAPSKMPQQSILLPVMTNFYENYTYVPTNCLVFTNTPDVWYEYNRSAAWIGFLTGSNQTTKAIISSYSCYVFDYGYWCLVPPENNGICLYATTHFKIETLTPAPVQPNSTRTAFYKILNYS